MISIIQTHIPRCPKCSAFMYSRVCDTTSYYICGDCLTTYKVLSSGQIDNEVRITDNIYDREDSYENNAVGMQCRGVESEQNGV